MTTGTYDKRIGDIYRLKVPPTTSARVLEKTIVAVARLTCDQNNHGLTKQRAPEDAYSVSLHLRQTYAEAWAGGRHVPIRSIGPGISSVVDLRLGPQAYFRDPFDNLNFHIPRQALDAIADDREARRIEELQAPANFLADDETLRHLAGCILPALDRPQEANRLFVDHVTSAVVAHVAQAYGDLKPYSGPIRGGLAPWQVRRATEMMNANLDGDIVLNDIARECGLSVSHFSRAFRRSVGLAPHGWLLKRRVDRAKSLLRERTKSLSEVALICGFADQSHFTRVFTREVGISPGAWRRSLQA